MRMLLAATVSVPFLGLALFQASRAFAHHDGPHDHADLFFDDGPSAFAACAAFSDGAWPNSPCANVQSWCYRAGSPEFPAYAFGCTFASAPGSPVQTALTRFYWYPASPCPPGEHFVGPPARCEAADECRPEDPASCLCVDDEAPPTPSVASAIALDALYGCPGGGEVGAEVAARFAGEGTAASCANECRGQLSAEGSGEVTVGLCVGGNVSIALAGEYEETIEHDLVCEETSCTSGCDPNSGCATTIAGVRGEVTRTLGTGWTFAGKRRFGQMAAVLECSAEVELRAGASFQERATEALGDSPDCEVCRRGEGNVHASVEGRGRCSLSFSGPLASAVFDCEDCLSVTGGLSVTSRTPTCDDGDCVVTQAGLTGAISDARACVSFFGYVMQVTLSASNTVSVLHDTCGESAVTNDTTFTPSFEPPAPGSCG